MLVSAGRPQDPNTFARFLGAMAAKYCGTSLKAIEVWNEQNLHYEWGNRPINPSEYTFTSGLRGDMPELLKSYW